MTTETLTEWVQHLTTVISDRTKNHYSVSSLEQALAAIRWLHKQAKQSAPDDTDARALIRAHGKRQSDGGRKIRRSAIVTPEQVADVVAQCDIATLTGLRDRFIVVTSFSAWTRRSELSALNISDIGEDQGDLVIFFRSSKTDQAGQGEEVRLKPREDLLCPLTAWREYRAALAMHGIVTGRALRRIDRWGNIDPGKDSGYAAGMSPATINDITKKLTAAAGCDTDGFGRKVTAHGWRASGYSAAKKNGASSEAARKHGRWSERSGIPDRVYDRAQDPHTENPMAAVPLVPAQRNDTADVETSPRQR
ncbi:site-specific integrase [Streptomyces erythrochromogenes]|uniref:hypothetical protein n=1 Tax=Streptomyces erythrochromogenes TaxID=285574 RepID=UPI0036FCC346